VFPVSAPEARTESELVPLPSDWPVIPALDLTTYRRTKQGMVQVWTSCYVDTESAWEPSGRDFYLKDLFVWFERDRSRFEVKRNGF
jgi:hypothetical protein